MLSSCHTVPLSVLCGIYFSRFARILHISCWNLRMVSTIMNTLNDYILGEIGIRTGVGYKRISESMLIALTAMTNSCLRLAVKLTNLLHWLKWMRSRTQFHINLDISLAGFVYILLIIIQQFYFHYWHYCTVPYNSTHRHLHSSVRSLHLCSCFKKLLSWLARWCFWTWTKWTQVTLNIRFLQ